MTGSDVRQLRGEDLERLAWADLTSRARSLAEAQALVDRTDEFDYLAACTDDRVIGIGAAGYCRPWGGAALVSITVDPRPADTDPAAILTALLARLEQRADEMTCTSVEIRIDALDVDTRAAVEGSGYGLVGATTALVPDGAQPAPQPGPGGRHVDRWVLRKRLA